jgi:hypothetical protein
MVDQLSQGAAMGGSAMLTEFNDLLTNTERDGEIFFDLISLVLG